jgi:pimeloyl-ACP methyl ester carboxylesterase
MLQFGGGTAAAIGVSAVAGALGPVRAVAQGASASNASAEDFFYREDWFGEPWRKPETAVLIHGNAESSIVWYAWMPRLAQEFRVLRPDLPGTARTIAAHLAASQVEMINAPSSILRSMFKRNGITSRNPPLVRSR